MASAGGGEAIIAADGASVGYVQLGQQALPAESAAPVRYSRVAR